MSKRKRLTPAQLLQGPPAEALPRAPIAQVAAETAAMAAFEEVAGELRRAEAEGRMVLALDLDQVAVDYLIRDRVVSDDDDLRALRDSLRARGQQMPIEVVDQGPGHHPRYGLISGWRRLLALWDLWDQTGDPRFGQVLALVRRPDSAPAAYVAMVEENEIRAGLSFYERARITLMAVRAGVYETEKKALQSLFSSASDAKRSKVKSFIPLVQALDGALRFPARIPERTGLALSKALNQTGFAEGLRARLAQEDPVTPEAEAQLLLQAMAAKTVSKPPISDASDIRLTLGKARVVLQGPGVDAEFVARLKAWLALSD